MADYRMLDYGSPFCLNLRSPIFTLRPLACTKGVCFASCFQFSDFQAAAEQADEPSKDMEKGSEVPDEAPKKGGMFAARDTHEEALKDGFLGEKAKVCLDFEDRFLRNGRHRFRGDFAS